MKIGLQLPRFTLAGGPAALGETLGRIARKAEEVGFSSLWVMDHFFQIEFMGPPDMEMLEGYTTLGYLAAHTRSLQLGTLVTGVTYRYPGLLVKTATTLDVLSGGRAWLGIGAAWFEREHKGLGVPFPPVAERFERLEEALEIANQMWSDDNGPYHGKHYRLEETLCVPQPLSRPHPPIMIGGMGEKKTLRLVARYAQACNLFEFAGPEVIAKKLAVLRGHCDDLGTDYDAIEKTTLGTMRVGHGQSVSEFLANLEKLASVGVDHAIYNMSDPTDEKLLDLVGEQIIAKVA